MGMVQAICGSVVGGGFISGADHIVGYAMMANASFGPYQMFNYVANKGRSVGSKGVANLVGKSIFSNFCSIRPDLPDCGQCTQNREGDWFSFPSSGKCAEGSAVGAAGCTWNVTSASMKNMT